MSCYDGSDNGDVEVKQEPIESGKVEKLEEFSPELEDTCLGSKDVHLPVTAQLQTVTPPGML